MSDLIKEGSILPLIDAFEQKHASLKAIASEYGVSPNKIFSIIRDENLEYLMNDQSELKVVNGK